MKKTVIVSKKERIVEVDAIAVKTRDGEWISLPDTSKVKRGDVLDVLYETEDGHIMPSSTVGMVIKGEILVNRLSFINID